MSYGKKKLLANGWSTDNQQHSTVGIKRESQREEARR